ncbi:MAG: metallophosphoesterase [Clostridia bacterium]
MKKFLSSFLALLFICGFLLVYARYIEPNMLTTNYISIEDGPEISVVVFGDTHFGEDYCDDNIEKIVEKINNAKADIVIFTGDFFDDYENDFKDLDLDYLQEQLSLINGIKIAVRGNHDIGGGIEFLYVDFMQEAGFEVLINEELYLEEYSLHIYGYDDSLLGEYDEEFYNQNNDDYNIFVIHEPDNAELLTGTATGIVLSGHSHGGQVYLPYITEKILPTGATKYFRGLYYSEDVGLENDVFVTTGIGTTFLPFRFLTVPEIVVINFGES